MGSTGIRNCLIPSVLEWVEGVVNYVRTAGHIHLYPESTTLITDIKATGVQLKPETYMEWSMALTLKC